MFLLSIGPILYVFASDMPVHLALTYFIDLVLCFATMDASEFMREGARNLHAGLTLVYALHDAANFRLDQAGK
jgi:hypothetical protein